MTDAATLRRFDLDRRKAMIAADANALDHLLADELCWTHSSGSSEDKADFIAAITSGAVCYEALNIEADTVSGTGNTLVHQGVLRGQASRDGLQKALNAKFLAVWRWTDERWQLTAWQSTHWSG